MNVGVDMFHHFNRFQSSAFWCFSGCWHGVSCVNVELDTKDWFGDAFFHETVPVCCNEADQFVPNVLWHVFVHVHVCIEFVRVLFRVKGTDVGGITGCIVEWVWAFSALAMFRKGKQMVVNFVFVRWGMLILWSWFAGFERWLDLFSFGCGCNLCCLDSDGKVVLVQIVFCAWKVMELFEVFL